MSVADLPVPGFPTPRDVLAWVAAARPELWFPSDHARTADIPRDGLDEPLWTVRQAGLVQVSDWVRGKGQGFTLTPAGETALADPQFVSTDPLLPTDQPLVVPSPTPTIKSTADQAEPTTYDRGEQARAAVLSRHTAIVTPVLIVANVVVFLAGAGLAWQSDVSFNEYFREGPVRVLLDTGAVTLPSVAAGDWWRLLTSCFVHIGLLHLVANMIGLLILGPMAEAMWGRARMIVIYTFAGLSGSCLAVALRPDVLLAGASGAIWGLMTAIIYWLVRNRSHLPKRIAQSQLRSLIAVLLVNAIISAAPGLSWEGHLGGGLAGLAAAALLDLVRPGLGWRRWAAVAGLVVVAAAGPIAVSGAIFGQL